MKLWQTRLKSMCTLIACCTLLPLQSHGLSIELADAKGAKLTLAGAVISAKPLSKTPQSTAPLNSSVKQTKQVAQRQRQFEPYISVIQTGSEISFPNYDQVNHHVYSFSKAKRFELPLYKQQIPQAISFEQAGIVTLGCNIHDWMLAYIQVVDTPFFSQFSQARMELELPDGDYQLELWHPDLHKKEVRFKTIKQADLNKTLVWQLEKKLKTSLKVQTPDEFGEDY